jgi:transketolase C-terminal domain/subunit
MRDHGCKGAGSKRNPARTGIDAAVLNVSTIKPLDTKTITDYAKKTGAIVTCEEHSVYGVWAA